MADLTASRSLPAIASCGLVRMLPPAARFSLRGAPQVMSAAGAALGLSISEAACRSARNGSRASLWLGPDEQLILAPRADGENIGRQLGAALAGLPHSLVDISHRQVALEVAGPQVQTLLNAGCPLDLHPSSFPVGMCTRTLIGKADIVLWRTGSETFHIEVWRSFADYVTRFMAEASRELTC